MLIDRCSGCSWTPVRAFAANDTITPTIESVRMFEKAGLPTELMLVDTTAHFPLAPTDAPRTKMMMKGWLDKFFPSPLSH